MSLDWCQCNHCVAACREAVAAIPQGVAIVSPDKVEVRPMDLDPKETTMTTANMAVAEPAENGADVDVLRRMVQFMAQRQMDGDVQARGAATTRRTPSG